MPKDERPFQFPVVLENLEPRLLLSAGILSEADLADIVGSNYAVQVVERQSAGPSPAPYPPPFLSGYVPDYTWIENNADYDWWFGCGPTAGGMLSAYWDYIGRAADPTADVFPGDPTNWVYTDITTANNYVMTDPTGVYADVDRRALLESELFTVPKYANGVVSGWNHMYEADWAAHIDGSGQYAEFVLDTWRGHTPDSIADFMLTETIVQDERPESPEPGVTVLSSTNSADMAWGIQNFMAWDDPRTEANESWRVNATYHDQDDWDYGQYQDQIDLGQPVILIMQDWDAPPDMGGHLVSSHAVLGVGYRQSDPNIEDPLTAMWVYTGWGSGLEEWDWGEMYDTPDPNLWAREEQSGYGWMVMGAITMSQPTRAEGLTGYFSLAHEAVEDLDVYIGLGDPSNPDWISGNKAIGTGVNLVRTDIDLSDALDELLALQAAGREEQWFLKVVDGSQEPRTGVSEIMDFQIRYNGQQWFTGGVGTAITLGEGQIVYCSTDLMGSVAGTWYNDLNGNGQRDAAEPGMDNEIVTIFADGNLNGKVDSGEFFASTVTDASGDYEFAGLMPGTYVVSQDLQAGRFPTSPSSQGRHVVPLVGQDILGLDFGSVEAGSVSGSLWNDLNQNGLIEYPGDNPMPGGISVFADVDGDGLFDAGQTVTFDSPVETDLADFATTGSQITVSGLEGTVLNVEVTLNVTHTRVGDLHISLVSPSGVSVLVFSRQDGDGLVNTVLSDGGSQDISVGSGSYTGTFIPEEPLSLFNGSDPNGIWTLVVTDAEVTERGTLDGWSLSIEAGEPYGSLAGIGYQIDGLMPGEYTIMPDLDYESGWVFSTPTPQVVQIESGTQVTGIDFGVYIPDLADLQAGGVADSGYAEQLVVPGDIWDANWRVVNAGAADVGQFDVAFYASLDATITVDDYYLGTVTVAGLNALPGSNEADVALSLEAFPDIPIGQYYVGVVIDPLNEIVESDETNNSAPDDAWPLTVPGIGGRLWAEQTGNTAFDDGEHVLDGWVVFLDGTGNGVVDGRLTGTEIQTTTDAEGFYAFPGLDVGSYNVNVALPTGWLLAFNTSGALITVNDLTEAYGAVDFGVLPTIDLYDSGPATSYFNPPSVTVGQTWSLWWDISNSGAAAATEGRVDFYAFVEGQEIADGHFLGSASIADNPIPAAGSQTFQMPLFSFPLIPAGVYRVGVVIDAGDDVIELDESNNTGVDDQFLVVLGSINNTSLGGQWVGDAPGVVHIGDSLETIWTIANNGVAPSGEFYVELYASRDGVISAAEDILIGGAYVGALPAGEQTDVLIQVHSLPELPIGANYIGILVDSADVVGESIESDNTYVELANPMIMPGIMGSVWDDADGDGIWKDGGDPTLAGRIFFLDTNANGRLDLGEAYARSNARGEVHFADLEAGTYTVSQLGTTAGDLAGWYHWGQTASGPDAGAYTVVYEAEELVTDVVYFANARHSKLGGTVWHDMDGNGAVNGLEETIEFWQVDIFRDDNGDGYWSPGEWQETVFTEEGLFWDAFQFSDLLPGTYVIEPAALTYLGGIADDPIFTTFGGHFVLEVTGGQLVGNNNFGVANAVTISGLVWEDMNRDGVRDSNDFGLGGWTLTIAGVGSTVSGSNGQYEFTGLAPGNYTVQGESRPDWTITVPSGGTWDVSITSLEDGPSPSPAADFGYYRYGEVYGLIFDDFDADGYMAPTETGRLTGWTVLVDTNENGSLDAGEAFGVTDSNGEYVIAGLDPGEHVITFVTPAGSTYVLSHPIDGTHTVSITSGSIYGLDPAEDTDFGFYLPAEITGIKWEDLDADGIREPGEPGLAGWLIFLDQNRNGQLDGIDSNGNGTWDPGEGEQFAVTDAGGQYRLTGLIPATTYRVAERMQFGWEQSLPIDGTYYDVGVTAGQILEDINFGNYALGQISGLKWNDLNGDGIRDAGEPGLDGWTVFLDENFDGQLDSTDENQNGQWDPDEGERWVVTDQYGNFTFSGLVPGDYLIVEQSRDGWTNTYPSQPWYYIGISSGDHFLAEFGNIQDAVISGTKWEDMDGDGVRDPGDDGMAGWTIYLDTSRNGILNWVDLNFNSQWDPGEGERWVVTDADGNYSFTGLIPGTYYVSEVVIDGWAQSYPESARYDVDVVSGSVVTGIDFGNSQRSAISGFKWNDLDADGLWDANEPGLANWTISVFMDRNGNDTLDPTEVDSYMIAVTDSTGYYRFFDLAPGTYIVSEAPQTNWIQTWPVAPGYYEVTLTSGESAGLNFGDGMVTANPLNLTMNEDQHLFWQVTGLDPAGEVLTFSLVSAPAHGSVTLNTNGTFQYLPQPNWYGIDSFSFRADTARGDFSVPANVTLQVNPVNDKPVAYAASADVNQNTSVAITLTGDDVETDPADLTFVITSMPSHGTVTIAGNVATYSPTPGYVGADSFGYAAIDTGDPAGVGTSPAAQSEEATVSVNVLLDNIAPVADSQDVPVPYDYRGEPIEITLTASDSETPVGDLIFEIANGPKHGTVTLVGNVATYTPFAGWTAGGDSFTFTVTDNGVPAGSGVDVLTSAPATVSVNMPVYDYFWQGHNATHSYVGQDVVCQMRGEGLGVAYYSNADPLLIEYIILTGTSDRTTVNINVQSPLFYKIGTIETRGPIGTINAKGLSLVGDVLVQGSARTINLGNTFAGTTDHLLSIGAFGRAVNLSLGQVADMTIDSAAPIGNLKVVNWQDTDGLTDMVFAPSVNRLMSMGDRRLKIVGDFGAGLDTNWVGMARIGGNLESVLWDIDSSMKTLSVTGRIIDGEIILGGGLGNLMAAQWDGGMLRASTASNVRMTSSRTDPTIRGDFSADMNLTGRDTRGNSLGKFLAYGTIIGSQMTFEGGAGSITAAQWNGGQLDAYTAGVINIKGNRRDPSISGDFSADVLLSKANSRGISLNKLSVLGTAEQATVRTAGSMNRLMMGAANGSDFMAGLDPTVTRHAEMKGDYVSAIASIRSVRINGLRPRLGSTLPRYFTTDSNFSAATVGSVMLRNIDYANSGNAFGIFALNQGTGKEIGSVKHTDSVTGESWNWSTSNQLFAQPDLDIRII